MLLSVGGWTAEVETAGQWQPAEAAQSDPFGGQVDLPRELASRNLRAGAASVQSVPAALMLRQQAVAGWGV